MGKFFRYMELLGLLCIKIKDFNRNKYFLLFWIDIIIIRLSIYPRLYKLPNNIFVTLFYNDSEISC